MAWTTPAAPGASALVTNSYWTTQVTNNFNETAPAKVTTKGDMIYATGANALTRLALGGAYYIMTSSGSTPQWVSKLTVQQAVSENGDAMYIGYGGANIPITAGVTRSGGWAWLGWNACQSTGDTQNYAVSNQAAYRLSPAGAGFSGQLKLSVAGSGTAGCPITWTDAMTFNSTGLIVGGTSNANMTAGVTTKSGGADERFTGKLTGFAHGVTSVTETDTAFAVFVTNAVTGGIDINAIRSGGTGYAARMRGINSVADTVRTSSARGSVHIDGALVSGTGTTTLSASGNVMTAADNGTTRFIWDAAGNAYAHVSMLSSAFDSYDDAALCRAVDAAISDPATLADDRFRDWAKYNREDLTRANLVHFEQDGTGAMVNYSGLARLHTGAIWQQENKIRQIAETVDELRVALAQSLETIAALSQRLLSSGQGA